MNGREENHSTGFPASVPPCTPNSAGEVPGGPGWEALILAAGEGTRMKSAVPKVLHPLAGRPLLWHVLQAVWQAGARRATVVVGHEKERVIQWLESLGDNRLRWVEQDFARGRGTAQAAWQALQQMDAAQAGPGPALSPRLVVLYGDTPLLDGETLRALVDLQERRQAAAALLTAVLEDPTGYGRVLRKGPEGDLERIVEERDATPQEKRVREINAGIYCFRSADLRAVLPQVKAENAQAEYYLPDVLPLLLAQGKTVAVLPVDEAWRVTGVNSRADLAAAAALLYRREARRLMAAGVTVVDPASTYVEPGVEVGPDTVIWPNTYLCGQTRIGAECQVGPSVHFTNVTVGDQVHVRFTVAEEARIGNAVNIGPFAYLRPGTVVEDRAKIGDFVEIKNSHIGAGSKVPHLTYIGDTDMGAGVNIGAGSITCNYDGFRKHRTFIGDGAFIGANNNLVAPVRVEAGAYTATGSTITTDVPADSLAVARARQRNIEGWAARRREKHRLEEEQAGQRGAVGSQKPGEE